MWWVIWKWAIFRGNCSFKKKINILVKRQLKNYIFYHNSRSSRRRVMHTFLKWYPSLVSLTKKFASHWNIQRKKEEEEVRHSHVQNGWWHIFFPSKRYFDDAVYTVSSYLEHHKNLPISHNAPHFSKSKKASWQIPRLYFTSLCANSKCEMAVNENYLAVII